MVYLALNTSVTERFVGEDMTKTDHHMDDSKTRHRHHSPEASVSSSQQDVRTGSSMSTSGSSEPTDIMSPVVDNRSTALPPTPPITDNAPQVSLHNIRLFCSVYFVHCLWSLSFENCFKTDSLQCGYDSSGTCCLAAASTLPVTSHTEIWDKKRLQVIIGHIGL